MIESLLRLIPAYRSMERGAREASDARLQLQGENLAMHAEIQRLQDEVREARDAERTAYRMIVNIDYQLRYGLVPFPGAPHLAERLMPGDGDKTPYVPAVSGGQLVEDAMAEARQEFDDYMKRAAS